MALYQPKVSELVLWRVFENDLLEEEDYERVKELAKARKLPEPLMALARFQKEEDIPFILKFDDENFQAIAAFPHPQFWPYLLEQYERLHVDDFKHFLYFDAVAKYQDEEALALFERVMQEQDRRSIRALQSAISSNNQTAFYEDLLMKNLASQ